MRQSAWKLGKATVCGPQCTHAKNHRAPKPNIHTHAQLHEQLSEQLPSIQHSGAPELL